ncbi:MAG: MtrAB system histidine kinase MtrB [Candidatus Nanopelagicales bacterium]
MFAPLNALRNPNWRMPAIWRRSLRFRVISVTLIGSLGLLALLGPLLLSQIAAGILGAKERSARSEATVARSEAQRLIDATSATGEKLSAARRVDAVVAAVAARGAESGLFDVLLLSSQPQGQGVIPERGTNLVSETSVPAEMRSIVAADQRQAWAYTTIRYTNGSASPGLVVGAPLEMRDLGPYELYQLFPLTQEQATLSLVRRSTLLIGLLMAAGLSLLAALVTVMLVSPVNQAARTARRLAAGDLEVRLPVRGEDDLAQLAMSFNEMATSLQAYIIAQDELSKVQTRFVADVTHELRTPLTTVRMAADLLHDKRAELPADDARAVELLQRQLDRFESLLADLLETSRADAGAVKLDYQPSDLVLLAERVIASLEHAAAVSGSAVRLRAPRELVLDCDAPRVERIISNLVANAIEHGEGKPIDVLLSKSGASAALEVRDHGVGLSPEQLDSVFTRFWRADPARARRLGGAGLGLPIALADARAHGGTITASGQLGRGASFVLLLPLSAPAGAGPAKGTPRSVEPSEVGV